MRDTDIGGDALPLSRQFKGSSDPVSTPAPRITLRLSVKEMEMLRSCAGDMSISAYVRDQLFGADAAPRKRRIARIPVADQRALGRVLGLLGQSRIANNLNQLAYHANVGSLHMGATERAQIEETYLHVRAMRATLIKALGLSETPR